MYASYDSNYPIFTYFTMHKIYGSQVARYSVNLIQNKIICPFSQLVALQCVLWLEKALQRYCGALEETFSSFSKCFRAFLMLIKVASDGMLDSDITTMTYVLLVKPSMKAANALLRTCKRQCNICRIHTIEALRFN